MALLETDPVDWELDVTTHDVLIPLRYVRGVPGVAQRIRVKLRKIKGEWFKDRSEGMPYVASATVTEDEAILGNKFDRSRVEPHYRRAILSVPGVDRIETIEFTFDNELRRMRVGYQVLTIWGKVVTGQEII